MIVYFQEGVFLAKFQPGEILGNESSQSASSIHSETHRPVIPNGDDSTHNSAPLSSRKNQTGQKKKRKLQGQL